MPNLVDSLRNRILAEYPTATVAERGRSHIKFRLPDAPDGSKRFAIDTSIGSLHYEDGGQWLECNTDWGDSDLSGFTDKADRCRFKAHAKSGGARRIYPRREVAGEYIEFGIMEYWSKNRWRSLPMGVKNRSLEQLTFDGDAVAVKLTVGTDALKLDFTLKTSAAPTRCRWPVTLTGLTLDESWQLVSTTDGTVVGTLPQPTMTDSSAEVVTRDVAATYAGGYIEYNADTSGLTYPIEIDPTVSVDVAADADSAYWGYDHALDTTSLYAGSLGGYYSSFARFTNVEVPSGATVDVCYVTVKADYKNGSSQKTGCYFEDADSPTAPTSATDGDGRTLTSKVDWDPAAWEDGTSYNTPALATICQVVIDRAGWASGNSMNWFWKDDGCSWDGLGAEAHGSYKGTPPNLHIEYTAGGTTHTIAATVNAASTTTAGAASKLVMAGTVTATATATAAAQKSAFASATIEGASTVTATAQANRYPAATIAGASSVTVAGVRTASLAATIESTAGVTAALTVEGTGETHEIGATINAASTITTSASKHLTATATVNAASSVTGTAQKAAYPAARVDGQSTAIVAAQKTAYPAADITPTSTTTAGMQRTALIGGNVTTSSTVTADAVRVATLAAILTTALSTSGTLTLAYVAAANIAAASVLSASLAVSELTTTELGTSMTAGAQMNPYRSLMTAGAQMRRVR